MFRTLKKNQIIIFAIALMLITTGYISYTMKNEQVAETSTTQENQIQIAGIGDARLVSNNNVIEQADANNSTNSGQNKTSQSEIKEQHKEEKDVYFSQSRLDRDKMYSEMLESYQAILGKTEISSEQRNSSQVEIQKINSQRNSIMIAENLIKNKGFKDVVIFVNNNSISVVIMADKIETAEAAQIQSIVQRELGVGAENIHISNRLTELT